MNICNGRALKKITLIFFFQGAITTATFTVMMRLSQTAPSSLQGTHYTVLATCEVFGKLVKLKKWFILLDLIRSKSLRTLQQQQQQSTHFIRNNNSIEISSATIILYAKLHMTNTSSNNRYVVLYRHSF